MELHESGMASKEFHRLHILRILCTGQSNRECMTLRKFRRHYRAQLLFLGVPQGPKMGSLL